MLTKNDILVICFKIIIAKFETDCGAWMENIKFEND